MPYNFSVLVALGIACFVVLGYRDCWKRGDTLDRWLAATDARDRLRARQSRPRLPNPAGDVGAESSGDPLSFVRRDLAGYLDRNRSKTAANDAAIWRAMRRVS